MRMGRPGGARASPHGMTLSGDDDGLASRMDWELAAALLFWCGAWPRLAYP